MAIAITALVTWVLTAGGGFVLLGLWLKRRGDAGTRLPAAVVFGHFGLAAIGLLLWVVYLFTDSGALAWTSFGLLLPVALLGLGMFLRWLPQRRGARTPESHFPVAIVYGHGALAVITVILVLLAALDVGGS